MIKIGIARLYTKNCSLSYNFDNVLKLYKQGVESNLDMVVFPRLALTGLDGNIFNKEKYLSYLEKIVDLTIGEKTTILIGGVYIEETADNLDEKIFDSVFFIKDGYIETISSRKEIAKDNIFNDYSFFDKNSLLEQVKYNKKKFSILISDDIYSNFNIFLVSDNKPDYIFCFDTSNKNIEYRKKHLIKLAKFANSPVFYINNATVFQNKIFKGELILINEEFEIKHYDIYKKNELFVFDIDCDDGTELFINNGLKDNFDIGYLLNKEKKLLTSGAFLDDELKYVDKSRLLTNDILKTYVNLDIYDNLSDDVKGKIIDKINLLIIN